MKSFCLINSVKTFLSIKILYVAYDSKIFFTSGDRILSYPINDVYIFNISVGCALYLLSNIHFIIRVSHLYIAYLSVVSSNPICTKFSKLISLPRHVNILLLNILRIIFFSLSFFKSINCG